jgi:hypothetical protein
MSNGSHADLGSQKHILPAKTMDEPIDVSRFAYKSVDVVHSSAALSSLHAANCKQHLPALYLAHFRGRRQGRIKELVLPSTTSPDFKAFKATIVSWIDKSKQIINFT